MQIKSNVKNLNERQKMDLITDDLLLDCFISVLQKKCSLPALKIFRMDDRLRNIIIKINNETDINRSADLLVQVIKTDQNQCGDKFLIEYLKQSNVNMSVVHLARDKISRFPYKKINQERLDFLKNHIAVLESSNLPMHIITETLPQVTEEKKVEIARDESIQVNLINRSVKIPLPAFNCTFEEFIQELRKFMSVKHILDNMEHWWIGFQHLQIKVKEGSLNEALIGGVVTDLSRLNCFLSVLKAGRSQYAARIFKIDQQLQGIIREINNGFNMDLSAHLLMSIVKLDTNGRKNEFIARYLESITNINVIDMTIKNILSSPSSAVNESRSKFLIHHLATLMYPDSMALSGGNKEATLFSGKRKWKDGESLSKGSRCKNLVPILPEPPPLQAGNFSLFSKNNSNKIQNNIIDRGLNNTADEGQLSVEDEEELCQLLLEETSNEEENDTFIGYEVNNSGRSSSSVFFDKAPSAVTTNSDIFDEENIKFSYA